MNRRNTLLLALTLAFAAAAPDGISAQQNPGSADPSAIAAALPSMPSLGSAAAISAQEYANRRAMLAQTMTRDGVFVVFGSGEPELDYMPFGQNSPFRYLTGILEPGATLLIARSGGSVTERIFVQPRSPDREVWDGRRLGADGAERLTGMRGEPAGRFRTVLDSLITVTGAIYSNDLPSDAEGQIMSREQQILADVIADHPGTELLRGDAITAIRSRKSPTEHDLIHRAGLITAIAQRDAIRSVAPGMNEFEILSLIEYDFRRMGADRPSFSTIVGSGPNSTTLHYRGAERWMNAGELVVMDIGASYRGYAADVTRTVPVSGTFSPDQRTVYQTVLDAQLAAERAIRVGANWSTLNQAANQILERGLTGMGLIDGPGASYDCGTPAQPNRCAQLRLFYMHALGHGVGLDVHDPEIGSFASFQEGSAFTLEPGIYVREDVLDYLPDTPGNREMIQRLRPAVERFANIGVRIEDMYLITADGVVRPSEGAPREIADVERLMAQPGLAGALRQPDIVEWYRQTAPAQ